MPGQLVYTADRLEMLRLHLSNILDLVRRCKRLHAVHQDPTGVLSTDTDDEAADERKWGARLIFSRVQPYICWTCTVF